MTLDKIKQDAESFFEWPMDKRTDIVTLTSCLLFAKHCVDKERERCAKLCEDASTYDEHDPGSSFATLIRTVPPAPEAA